jgi:hypothetical protein
MPVAVTDKILLNYVSKILNGPQSNTVSAESRFAKFHQMFNIQDSTDSCKGRLRAAGSKMIQRHTQLDDVLTLKCTGTGMNAI